MKMNMYKREAGRKECELRVAVAITLAAIARSFLKRERWFSTDTLANAFYRLIAGRGVHRDLRTCKVFPPTEFSGTLETKHGSPLKVIAWKEPVTSHLSPVVGGSSRSIVASLFSRTGAPHPQHWHVPFGPHSGPAAP